MIQQAVTYIETIIRSYGAWGVFVATFIEEAVAPIPSALVPTVAGFFLVPADSAFPDALMQAVLLIGLPVAIGVTIGSALIYALAYYGGKPLIDRFGGWIGLHWEEIEAMQKRFTGSRSDELVLFVFRVIPIIPGVGLSGFCGVIRYPFAPFAAVTFAGAFVRSVVLGLLGWQAGELYHEYFEAIERIEGRLLTGVLVIVALAAVYYFWNKLRRKARR